MMAAILTIGGPTLTLTSCVSNDDNAVVTPSGPGPMAEKIEGLWWSDRNVKGKLPENEIAETVDKSYVKIVQAYQFKANGSAQWAKLYINEKGELVDLVGSLYDNSDIMYPDGSYGTPWFNFTTAENGTITITNNKTDIRPDIIPQTWQVKYHDGAISVTDNGIDFELQPADDQMTEVLNAYNRIANSGGNGPGDGDEVAESLKDVKYEIIRDTAMWKFDILSNVYGAIMRDHDIEAELEKMRKEAQKPLHLNTNTTRAAGTTRSVADPKVVWSPSGFRYIDYTYESVDEQGRPITLSSRVCWGVTMLYGSYYDEFRPCDLVLCAHSTIADDLEAPTLGGSAETLMLQGDRVLILPDYIGYGVTKDRVHPYINHDLCARNCIDALKAGYKVFADKADAYKPSVDHSKWMAPLADSRMVADLSLPGTHNACTAEGWHLAQLLSESTAKAQDLTIDEQLKVGVRVFDLRPERVLNAATASYELRCSHGIVQTSLLVKDFFLKLKTFLAENPTEFCIVTCNLTNSNDPVGYSNWRKDFAELINGSDLSGLFADFKPAITVGEMRGRVLLLSRYEYDGNIVGGICQDWSNDKKLANQTKGKIKAANGSEAPLWTQDYYAVGSDLTGKDEAIRYMLDATAARDMTSVTPAWVFTIRQAT